MRARLPQWPRMSALKDRLRSRPHHRHQGARRAPLLDAADGADRDHQRRGGRQGGSASSATTTSSACSPPRRRSAARRPTRSTTAGRAEMAAKERAEAAVIADYLPEQLDRRGDRRHRHRRDRADRRRRRGHAGDGQGDGRGHSRRSRAAPTAAPSPPRCAASWAEPVGPARSVAGAWLRGRRAPWPLPPPPPLPAAATVAAAAGAVVLRRHVRRAVGVVDRDRVAAADLAARRRGRCRRPCRRVAGVDGSRRSATVKPAASQRLLRRLRDAHPADVGHAWSGRPLTSVAVGLRRSRCTGSHCWMACIASPHIGPAVVEPWARRGVERRRWSGRSG